MRARGVRVGVGVFFNALTFLGNSLEDFYAVGHRGDPGHVGVVGAQEFRATVRGQVVDSSQAALPGATVNVTRMSADKNARGGFPHDEKYVGEVVRPEDGGCVQPNRRVPGIGG